MVLAGPGSGKTTVIVNRIQALISTGTGPEQILVITFTRAAAKEMEERYQRAAGKSRMGSPVFGTFHSVFFSILKKHCGFSGSNIVTPSLQKAIIRKVLSDPALPLVYTDDIAELLLSEVSRIKNSGGPERAGGPRFLEPESFFRFYRSYDRALRSMGQLDFDDMLLLCLRLFEEKPQVLLEERRRFRYFLVDEFQDINALQYRILRLMAYPGNNLFIVGDDDQSIYGFRGSDPGIMLGFPRDYPKSRTLLLGLNYRSGRQIIEASGTLIGHNRNRFKKKLSPGSSRESGVFIREYETEEAEYRGFLRLLLEQRSGGVPLGEVAALGRTNGDLLRLTEFLKERGIPYRGKSEEGEGLRMMTFHGSKGLEFDHVFILNANEGVTPHKKNGKGEALEEERRMFYVAMTRARKNLHILYTKSRYNRTQKRSRFVTELLEDKKGLYGRFKGFGSR